MRNSIWTTATGHLVLVDEDRRVYEIHEPGGEEINELTDPDEVITYLLAKRLEAALAGERPKD